MQKKGFGGITIYAAQETLTMQKWSAKLYTRCPPITVIEPSNLEIREVALYLRGGIKAKKKFLISDKVE